MTVNSASIVRLANRLNMKTIEPPREAHDGSRFNAYVGRKSGAGPAGRAIQRTPMVAGLRRRFGFRESSTCWEKRSSHHLPLLALERLPLGSPRRYSVSGEAEKLFRMASPNVNSGAAKDRCRFPLGNTHRAINGLIGALIMGSAVIAKAVSPNDALDELQFLFQLPSDLIAQCQASVAEEVLVENNRTDVFVTDEQREAMNGLVAGLVLKHDNYAEREGYSDPTHTQRYLAEADSRLVLAVPISGSMWSFFWYVFPATLAGSLVGILVENLIPGEKQSWTSRLRAIPIWAVYILIGLSISAVLQYCLGLLHIHPLVLIDLRKTTGSKDVLTAIVAYTALPCVGFLVYDFLYYWFHRILHNITVLWRVHSVHHSIEELNAVNDYHHWLEDALRVPLILVPVSLLVRVDATVLIICIMILRFMGQMTHANSKISYGFLRYVIAEPRFHRIHHSLEERHFEKNFAFMFPMWDVIFGTVYFPGRDEYPKTGLADQREPRSVLSYVINPFKSRR